MKLNETKIDRSVDQFAVYPPPAGVADRHSPARTRVGVFVAAHPDDNEDYDVDCMYMDTYGDICGW